MDGVKVLMGSPVNQEPAILKEYLDSLNNMEKGNLYLDFIFIDDNTSAESKALLRNFKFEGCRIDIYDAQNTYPYVHTEVTHKWDEKNIWKVAYYRNRLISICREKSYDYLFMVDSDLLLHPKTLLHLIEQDKDIISEIFWTRWAPGAREFPQVWLYDNFTQYEVERCRSLSDNEIKLRTEAFLNKLRKPGLYKVGGLGACTLISKKALNSGVSYDRIPNLSFPGEDRHFCIRAQVLGFELFVDTHYPAYHIYRKSELKGAAEFKRRCGYNK